jgi:hypothetical protein
MEFNELVQVGEWLELRHVVNKSEHKNYIVVARFSKTLATLSDIHIVARLLGYPLG